jgi:hypothetical protein
MMHALIKTAAAALTASTLAMPAHAALEMDLRDPPKRVIIYPPAAPSPVPQLPLPLPEMPYRIDEACNFILIVNTLTAPVISNDNSWYNLQNRIFGYIQSATPPRCRDGKQQPVHAWRDGVSTQIGTYSMTPAGSSRIRLQRDKLLKTVAP